MNTIEAFINGTSFHWDCYLTWDNFIDFAKEQFKLSCESIRKSSFEAIIFENEKIMFSITVVKPYVLHFNLCATGSELAISIESWERICLHLDFCPGVFFIWPHPFEEKAFRKIFPLLAGLFPTKQVIAQKTDWSGTEYHLYAPLE